MTSINKILLLFILVIFTSFVGIWEFVQSEFFAGILSKNVTKYSKEYLGADLSFEKVNFKLFPPGVEINNVILEKKSSDNISYATQVSGLGISFNPLDLFETDLTIDQLYLNDGVLRLKNDNTKNTSAKNTSIDSSDIKISKILNEVRSRLPFTIKNIEFNKLNLSYNNNSIVTHHALLTLKKDHLDISLILRNFNLNQMNLYEEVLDEVQLNASVFDDLIEVQELILAKNMNVISIKGEVEEFYDLQTLDWSLEGSIKGQVVDIHKYLSFEKVGKIYEGVATVNLESEGSIADYYLDATIGIENLTTDFVDADKATLDISVDNENIIFKDLSLRHKNGSLKLTKEFEFFNFRTNKFVEENIFVNAKTFKITNALKYLKNTLGILHGKLSGDVEFVLNPNDFKFIVGPGMLIDDLKLITSENSDSIINPTQIKVNSGLFDIKDTVLIKLDAELNNSKIKTLGTVQNNTVKFSIQNGIIDVSDMGQIAGFDLKGEGGFNLEVLSNSTKQEIVIISSLEKFSFDGYEQDAVKSTIKIDLLKNQLNIKKFVAKTGQTQTEGYFNLGFDDLDVDAKVYQNKFSVSDINKMYSPAVKELHLSAEKMYGDWRTEVQLSGKLTLKDLVLDGRFIGQNNFIYGESFDLIQLKYNLKNAIFGIEDFYGTKANGAIQGGVNYNINTQDTIFWGNINKVPLVEINNFNKIPTNLTGKLSGFLKGSIQKDDFNVESEVNISESKVHNKNIGNSFLKIKFNNGVVDYNTSLLGKFFEASGKVQTKDENKDSEFKWKINSADLNDTLSILTFVDHLKTGFSGQAYLGGEGKFRLSELNKFTADLSVDKLYLNKGSVDLKYESKGQKQIVVSSGKIKKWDVNIRGKKFYIASKGKGDIAKKYDIKTRVKADANLLEVFNELISKSSGTLLGSIHNYKNGDDEDYVAKLVSNNLTMSSDYMPLALSKGDLLVNYKKKKFILNKLNAQLNSGNLLINGTVDVSRLIPDINIRYEFKNAGIPLLKKSSLTFSGKGSFVGKTVPYTLGGDFQIQKCSIVNEITDFGGGESIIKSEIDYLPQDKSSALNQFVNLNINVNTLEPIRITNSMADLGFTGNLLLTGGEREPRLSGKISLAPIKNQIFFKNNTFDLTKGNVFFYERNKITNPELDFQAKSVINKYNVNISLLGQLKEFKMDLNSDPVLSQSDILSLVAFGYTEDLSTNLSDSEKESMTRAGVGSIIFDRFKINETLKNEFGLQVNLGTEISQEEGSYLSQKNAEGGEVGKVRSATTIEIKKQINEAIDLSVSSTVGGTVGQKQSMNLNYNLNKNLSVEGVYESNTETQSEELINDSSLGADVKIRWSFK